MARKIKRDQVSKTIWGLQVNPPVFFIATAIIILSVALTLIFHDRAEGVFINLQELVASNADWFFIICLNIFIIFLFYLALSKFGQMRIGGPKAKPEFKTTSWFAMLFSAGMGISLLFFGVGEPILHFSNPPNGVANESEAAIQAMNFTFLHYGLQGWAAYALVGLSMAYFSFTRGLPLTIRSVFYPVLGNKIYGIIGHAIDILAVLATIFGLATSLGLGVQQIATGLNFVFGWSSEVGMQILYIAIVTLIATVSVILGVDKGVKILSEWNMRIALFLLLLVVILGPTLFIFRAFVENTGSYIANLIEISFWSETYTEGKWQNNWTIFYWGWWIGWSPFVGMFIARISKGKTLREFILGVLLVPSLLAFFWMT
ncbi:MAG TPA: BCCT family transporter, partial [Flavobacteriaceae bacterium]|nr:BCCT family transporter [Flavobacteriaceae bacterium]